MKNKEVGVDISLMTTQLCMRKLATWNTSWIPCKVGGKAKR